MVEGIVAGKIRRGGSAEGRKFERYIATYRWDESENGPVARC